VINARECGPQTFDGTTEVLQRTPLFYSETRGIVGTPERTAAASAASAEKRRIPA
jgi:hypothetical protein